jgi:hypothetical protein
LDGAVPTSCRLQYAGCEMPSARAAEISQRANQPSSPPRAARLESFLHRSLQYFTSSQLLSHFFRHVICAQREIRTMPRGGHCARVWCTGLPHCKQSLAFFICPLSMIIYSAPAPCCSVAAVWRCRIAIDDPRTAPILADGRGRSCIGPALATSKRRASVVATITRKRAKLMQ